MSIQRHDLKTVQASEAASGRYFCGALLLVITSFLLGGCGQQYDANKKASELTVDAEKTLTIAQIDWPQAEFFNAYLGFILREGFGYTIDYQPGSDAVLFKALKSGEVDLHLAMCRQELFPFQRAVTDGDLLEVGELYDDARQGYYVPRYVIEGDPARGLLPLAPDLRSVADLKRYPQLFSEQSGFPGLFVGAPRGWKAASITAGKLAHYNLLSLFELRVPHSAVELEHSLLAALEEGRPWVGFYWNPSWIQAKYDLVLLQEPALNKGGSQFGSAFSPDQLVIAAHPAFVKKAPDAFDFLKRFNVDVEWVSEVLAQAHKSHLSLDLIAIQKLRDEPERWISLVPSDVAVRLNHALDRER